MKKPERVEGGARRSSGTDERFKKAHPLLWEHVSEEVWDDGTPRATTTMFLFCDSGVWKLMLKDRALGNVAFFTGATMDDLLRSAERALAGGTADWRPDRPPAGRGRK